MSVPELEPHCGSWVVTRRDTGTVIGEFYVRASVERFDPARVRVETAAHYLARINRELAGSTL